MFRKRFYYFSIRLLHLTFLQSCLILSFNAQTPSPTPVEEIPIKTEEKVSPEVPQSLAPTPAETPDLTEKSEADFIHFGDLIDVDIVGSTENDWRGTLSPDGFLGGINYIEEPVFALCRTERELAAEIAKGISRVLRDPQIIVRIIDRSKRPVTLLYGAVRTPLRFQIRRAVRLNELLILSGGLTERASGEIQIFRPPNLSCQARIDEAKSAGAPHTEKPQTTPGETREKFIAATANQNSNSQFLNIKIADLLKGVNEANPFVLSGDVITVHEAEPIYVIGGVLNPKQINALAEITLSRAISAAGGFAKNADQKNITVFRRENGAMKIIEIDFAKVKSGEAEDIVLRSLDIIEVAQFGREKRKFPPVVNVESRIEGAAVSASQPPLRIID